MKSETNFIATLLTKFSSQTILNFCKKKFLCILTGSEIHSTTIENNFHYLVKFKMSIPTLMYYVYLRKTLEHVLRNLCKNIYKHCIEHQKILKTLQMFMFTNRCVRNFQRNRTLVCRRLDKQTNRQAGIIRSGILSLWTLINPWIYTRPARDPGELMEQFLSGSEDLRIQTADNISSNLKDDKLENQKRANVSVKSKGIKRHAPAQQTKEDQISVHPVAQSN